MKFAQYLKNYLKIMMLGAVCTALISSHALAARRLPASSDLLVTANRRRRATVPTPPPTPGLGFIAATDPVPTVTADGAGGAEETKGEAPQPEAPGSDDKRARKKDGKEEKTVVDEQTEEQKAFDVTFDVLIKASLDQKAVAKDFRETWLLKLKTDLDRASGPEQRAARDKDFRAIMTALGLAVQALNQSEEIEKEAVKIRARNFRWFASADKSERIITGLATAIITTIFAVKNLYVTTPAGIAGRGTIMARLNLVIAPERAHAITTRIYLRALAAEQRFYQALVAFGSNVTEEMFRYCTDAHPDIAEFLDSNGRNMLRNDCIIPAFRIVRSTIQRCSKGPRESLAYQINIILRTIKHESAKILANDYSTSWCCDNPGRSARKIAKLRRDIRAIQETKQAQDIVLTDMPGSEGKTVTIEVRKMVNTAVMRAHRVRTITSDASLPEINVTDIKDSQCVFCTEYLNPQIFDVDDEENITEKILDPIIFSHTAGSGRHAFHRHCLLRYWDNPLADNDSRCPICKDFPNFEAYRIKPHAE